jgi:hypothetical protein
MDIFETNYKVFSDGENKYLRSKGNDAFIFNSHEDSVICLVKNKNAQNKLDKLGLLGAESTDGMLRYTIPSYHFDKVAKLLKLIKK